MDQVQIAILALLQAQAVGHARAMTADIIFNTLSGQHVPVVQGRTQEHIRFSIGSMVRDHGQLIGSGPNGYYLISTKDELIDTIMDLVDRSRSNLERVDALKTLWNNQNPNNRI